MTWNFEGDNKCINFPNTNFETLLGEATPLKYQMKLDIRSIEGKVDTYVLVTFVSFGNSVNPSAMVHNAEKDPFAYMLGSKASLFRSS